MSSPSSKTVKQLFALSKNRCAFPKCTVAIILEENNTVVGEICHIKGRRPGAARYDPAQTDEERNAFANLILMCSLHHKVIDEDFESYSVERLVQIKSGHESVVSPAALTDDEQSQFDKLLDHRIRLIIEHEKAKAEQPESTDQGSGPFALAKQMADRRRFAQRRSTIFKSIDERCDEEKENLSILGISLHSAQKHRVVATDEFGNQIVLEGFDGANNYRVPENLRFEITLFGKRPIRQPGAEGKFYSNHISGTTLKPDFNDLLQTIWVDDKKVAYSEDQLVDKIFDHLLQKLEEERKIAETLPEGRYRRGGQYVDIWGNPIRDEHEFEDWV